MKREKYNNLDENIEAMNRRAERYHNEVQQFFEQTYGDIMHNDYNR